MSKKRSLFYSAPGAYILPRPRKITKKKTKTKSYYKGQNGKKTKRGQKKSKIKKQHEQCWKLEQCAGGLAILQPTKFRRLRNFRNPAKFLQRPNFLAFSALLSFWFLICNAEFDSNSSCLDRLNNFGINSLQKLQNYPRNTICRIVGTLMCKSG